MNQDSVWMLLRYAIIGLGALAVGRGWATSAQIEMLAGAVVSLGTVVWGMWVRWRTMTIPETSRPDIPRVSPATGVVEPPTFRDVRWLQRNLNLLLNLNLAVDGVYGDDTRRAVTEFQRKFMSPEDVDGWAGSATFAILLRELGTIESNRKKGTDNA